MGVYRKNNEWYIDYYFQGRRKREKVGPSKKLAQEVLNKRKIQIAENRFLDIKKDKKIKFKDFSEIYLEDYAKPNKRSWKRDLFSLKLLNAYFGDRYLYEITTSMVERYKSKRHGNVSVATVNRELACLKCIFNKAILWNMTGNNPAKSVKLFKENNARLRYLEKEEIAKLLSNCPHVLKAVVTVAINTGMRKSEIQNLKWRDINFKRGYITLKETKNGSTRIIPMNQAVKECLFSLEEKPNSPYIFCGKNGGPFNFRKAFETALKKTGIKDFKFHDLRHTFASHLVMSGTDLNTVRELLGHKDLSMTLRYSHLSPDHKSRAVDKLGFQMDTIWTPEANSDKVSKTSKVVTILEEVN